MEPPQLAKALGEKSGAGRRYRRNAPQVENDKMRARFCGELPRNVIDIGKCQGSHQFDDADVLLVLSENFLLVRPPAAPRRAFADVVVGDDVARVVAAV